MTDTPYRPVITDGDPLQKSTGCNITQSASNFSANQPSAAQVAAEGQANYAAYRAQNEAWRQAIERRDTERQVAKPEGGMLRPDQIG